jgi:hypothetical protein
VKVGRAAFDPEAIRVLEELHPEVRFDWNRILDARPPAPVTEPAQGPPRRAERRAGRGSRAAQAPEQKEPNEVARLDSAPPDWSETSVPPPTVGIPAAASPVSTSVERPPGGRRFTRVFDRETDQPEAAAGEGFASAPSAAERVLGSTRLELLRGRYAEVLTRLDARVGDAARRAVLRDEAERLNPDGWVTEGDVLAGAEGFEAAIDALNRSIGRRRRRRRSRRASTSPESMPPGSGQDDAAIPGGESPASDAADTDDLDENR